MKKQTLRQPFFVLISLLICNLLYSQNEEQKTIPLKDGMARIYFKRHSNLMGGAVVHLVVDKGDSLNFNSQIIEKKSFPPEKSNFDKAGNVKLMYVKMNQNEAKLVIGIPQKNDKPVNHPFNIKSFPELDVIPGPFMMFLGLDPVYFVNSDPFKLNIRIVGAVGSGGNFYWDRPAGIVQIEDITPGGDEAFAPSFKVEAGKTYTVDYYYMKAKFDIKEKK